MGWRTPLNTDQLQEQLKYKLEDLRAQGYEPEGPPFLTANGYVQRIAARNSVKLPVAEGTVTVSQFGDYTIDTYPTRFYRFLPKVQTVWFVVWSIFGIVSSIAIIKELFSG